MSDTKNPLIKFELPNSVDNAVKNLTDKPTLNVGQTISDMWYLVFGGVSQAAEKKKLRYSNELNLFKNDLDTKLNSIPEEKKVEPKMQIVGPALENSKYCVESEELRNMFSNLIANSMNSDFADIVHPSFGEIIKQLSPIDAKVFRQIMESDQNPLISIKNILPNGSYNYVTRNLTRFTIAPVDIIEQSIENLCRLNLVTIPSGKNYGDKSLYEVVRNTPEYRQLTNSLKSIPGINLSDETGILDKTSFGKSFAKVCMDI